MEIKIESAWRWVQLARFIRTKTPAQHHLLLVLALHANKAGTCWPSYETLMRRCGFGSKHTVLNALKYLRDELQILDWKQGHANQFKPCANTYQFRWDEMVALAKKCREQEKEQDKAEKVAECS